MSARSARSLLATLTLLLATAAAAVPGGTSPAGPADPAVAAQPASLELVTQSPTVPRGGTFELWLGTDLLPPDGSIDLVLRGRVRSRSELAASMEGGGLRSSVYRVSTLVAALPAAADGSRRLAVSLDPAVAGGVALTTSGAYPVEVIARDAAGAELDRLITHLLVEPSAQDESPALGVAVVAELDARPALQPDGTTDEPDLDLTSAAELVAALTANPDVVATVAMRPETVEALGAVAAPEATALLDALPGAVAGRDVLALPYVDVSPDALLDAGLAGELADQLERGRELLADAFGVEPSVSTWLADDDLGPDGLTALSDAGVRHVVVEAGQVEPLRSGVLSLSLAQPFLLDSQLEPAVDALALDPDVMERLDTSAGPGLETSRLLAELAMLWFEQPGIERAVVIPVDPTVRPEVVSGLLDGLDGGTIFEAVTLDDAFAGAAPLRQPGGGLVDRPLTPERSPSVAPSVARGMREARARLASFSSLLGPDSPRAEPVAAHLLLATARALDGDAQRAHLRAAATLVEEVTSAISAPDRATITLTAREGTVPLTVRNAAGIPVDVVVRLRSQKLEFPAGDTVELTLSEETTRLDLEVRARASGSLPLQVEVTSPDGGIALATIDVTVQSTAVSGVGVVLSVGAALFLMVWWARHWRRTRRSQKLVATTHPAVRDAQ